MATCQLGVSGGLGWWQVCAAYAPLCFKHRVFLFAVSYCFLLRFASPLLISSTPVLLHQPPALTNGLPGALLGAPNGMRQVCADSVSEPAASSPKSGRKSE